MKKQILIIVVFFIAFTGITEAQESLSKNAIGLRLGDKDDTGLGLEATYQRMVSSDNRIELDFGWRSEDEGGLDFDLYKLTGLYHWVFGINKGLYWYVGPGASLRYLTFDSDFTESDSEFDLFIAGTVGIEYNFAIPLQLSFDIRPEFGVTDNTDDLEIDWGLSVRYKF
ncbi:outer membrane beta-barrel protein [Aquimarina sp. U1-2]|uniref:outer membrane beta-barrel protein n=1 Tax=Aquimarina sp. U1-2 TaxID=2823141 RepID=UPI001AECB19D|nr:outer membrane beta-barrel protein [Aquimarina sp. U1-2]MBP2833561.1 outer membrane beta-barrel protein [Aquimarina sp. U1-2]